MKRPEPVGIVVAKAKVKGSAEIEVQPIARIDVKPKQPVHVKYLYKLEESSKDKESWRFRLQSQIGTQAPAPATAHWEDRWGRNDTLWGTLQQEFVFDQPGTYEGSFQVHAEYAKGDWGSAPVSKQHERSANGRFQIRVVR